MLYFDAPIALPIKIVLFEWRGDWLHALSHICACRPFLNVAREHSHLSFSDPVLPAIMLRRFSTKVGINKSNKRGDKDENANGNTIGSAQGNGVVNGSTKPAIEKRRSSFGPLKALRKDDTPDHSGSSSGSRADVDSSFNQFAQLLHSARRPLPNQSGDGSYLDQTEPSGLIGDIRKMGFKDARTLMDVVKTKASGELQDDKTYIMERTIQARAPVPKARM